MASPVAGQLRDQPIGRTLVAASEAARDAGVTRLADLTGVAPLGIPVFQAIRPLGRLFSVSQGKGLTPSAAKVSALLEAVETDLAERVQTEGRRRPLSALDASDIATWHGAPREWQAISVDPDMSRHWTPGRDLLSGRALLIPWDLLSLDFTRTLPADVQPSSLGLAAGNNEIEATASAVAELLEHDLDATFDAPGPVAMRQCELNLDSVDDPIAAPLLRRLRRRGIALRIWSVGQDAGLAAFRCLLTDADWRSATPPVNGNGCHPDRTIALLRAVLEAAQARCTMVAGAREDLEEVHYQRGAARNADLILGSLSFGPGPLPWSAVPHTPVATSQQALDILLGIAARRSSLPIAMFRHRKPHADLVVVHCLGVGLQETGRAGGQSQPPQIAPITATIGRMRKPVLFVGPTLSADDIGDGIEIRPPARCGDLAALLADPPAAVGLIDGVFEMAPTVWHKEILDLLALGVRVFGGASLGALRAAELGPFGMTGIGAIFEAYRDGQISRDDAVMMSHAPAELGAKPLTIALVDAEAALAQAGLEPPVLRQLQRIVRTIDFRERTWPHCLALYRVRTGKPAPIDASALECASTLKHRDALALVRVLATAEPGTPRPRPPITAHYALLLSNRLPALRRDCP